MKKRKLKRTPNGANQVSEDDEDYLDGDDESFYDDSFIHHTMSGEEDNEDINSYRNQTNPTEHKNEKLNESTADFNKEIRQIN
jgi:hypothetical protein